MAEFCWLTFCSCVGTWIGLMVGSPWIGLGIGFAIGLIVLIIAYSGPGGFADVADDILDAFDD